MSELFALMILLESWVYPFIAITSRLTLIQSGSTTPHSPNLHNWSLTIKYNLMSYSEQPFLGSCSSAEGTLSIFLTQPTGWEKEDKENWTYLCTCVYLLILCVCVFNDNQLQTEITLGILSIVYSTVDIIFVFFVHQVVPFVS